MSQDAFEQLKSDHANLKQVMHEIEESINSSSDEIKEQFDKFLELFNDYDYKKSELVYPILKEHKALTPLVLKSYQAHHIAKVGIMQLKLLSFSNEIWGPKFLAIKDCISQHIDDEENKLFKEAVNVLDPSELDKITDELNAQLKENV